MSALGGEYTACIETSEYNLTDQTPEEEVDGQLIYCRSMAAAVPVWIFSTLLTSWGQN